MSGLELIGPEVDAEWKRLLMQLISERLTDFTDPLSDAPESLNFRQHVATPLSKKTLMAVFEDTGIIGLLASLGITNIRLHGWLYIINKKTQDCYGDNSHELLFLGWHPDSLHPGDFRLVENHSNVPGASLTCFKSGLSEKRGSEKFTGATTSSLIELNNRSGGTVPWYYEALEEGSKESPKDLYVHHQIVCPATASWTHDGTEYAFCTKFLDQCRTQL